MSHFRTMLRGFFALLVFFAVGLYGSRPAYAQCSSLRPQISIDFDTDQDCAPVTVTDFTITYFFNSAQDPNDIEIRFEWNDPGNNVDVVNVGSGLISAAGNTEFTASAPTFTYFDNDGQCTIIPTAYVYINGALCPTSEEVQTAFFWGTDEQANAQLSIVPANYDVCYNNPVVNAVFRDNSEFNCNRNVEPDRPNEDARHVQFVYGTNHTPAATILDLSLQDGGTQPLTNGAGTLVNPQTRGTAGLQVTGGYFGPVETIPFPANGPNAQTFPMSAPANLANLVNNRFEVTLFNWNICNPWNGDPLNPNYDDAISTTAYIVIVDGPEPDFWTRENNAAGDTTSFFCVGDNIYFDNQTPGMGGLDFRWEFYDDAAGTTLLDTRNRNNPTYAFNTEGQKLIRLIAENPTAQGSCVEEFEKIITISAAMVAQVGITDLAGNPIPGLFCQDLSTPQDFPVRFTDQSSGTPNAFTRWRWEFYDENNTLTREEPAGGLFSSTPLGPFDEVFTDSGNYRVRLITRDEATGCQSENDTWIRVFENPIADFNSTRVCEGEMTRFEDVSTVNAINGETIVSWEWDFDYDGTTFNKNAAFDNETSFDHALGAPGTYNVALRVMTDQNACAGLTVIPVIVDPLPIADISTNQPNGCSVLEVVFNNNGVGVQPAPVQQYIWEVNDGSGYVVDSVQNPSDPGFSAQYTRYFENLTSSDLTYDVRLRAITTDGCEQISAPVTVVVGPGPVSGFNSLNYSPFDDNCSPVVVDFEVDNATLALNPASFLWTIVDEGDTVDQQDTGTDPNFSYVFNNQGMGIKDFWVTLTSTLSNGCSRDSTRLIRVNPVPSADFTVDTLQFDCEVMHLDFEAITKGLSEYRWELRINNVVMLSSSAEGDRFDYRIDRGAVDQNVEVSLQTTNFANCTSSTVTKAVFVGQRPQILTSFEVTPISQTLPNRMVTLVNTTNPGPWTYEWDLGDSTTSTDPDLGSHQYATFGTYIITLTARLDECIETATRTITINPIPPIVDFDYAPPSGCAPLEVQFTNLSQFADSTSYSWRFGANEGISRAVNPTYTYFTPGVYTVSLSATNVLGDTITETKSMIIEVFEPPRAQFNVRPRVVLIPDQPLFTDNNSFGANSFLWDFGDGSTSTEFEPQHFYQQEGTYDISLIAYSTDGCTDTTRRESLVQARTGGRLLIPNAFTPDPLGSSGGRVGNGLNDVFLPLTQGVAEFEMFIFNRWGELLFRSDDKTIGWDGYFRGRLCAQDVYVYKLNLVFENGESTVRTGDVNLIR